MHQMLAQTSEWENNHHVEKGIIYFQNKETFSNVKLTNESFLTIAKNSRGFENLADAIENPNEIWSYWETPKKQLVTIRNYILFGNNGNYVVNTKDCIIQNAIFVVNSRVDRYRTGLLLIR